MHGRTGHLIQVPIFVRVSRSPDREIASVFRSTETDPRRVRATSRVRGRDREADRRRKKLLVSFHVGVNCRKFRDRKKKIKMKRRLLRCSPPPQECSMESPDNVRDHRSVLDSVYCTRLHSAFFGLVEPAVRRKEE